MENPSQIKVAMQAAIVVFDRDHFPALKDLSANWRERGVVEKQKAVAALKRAIAQHRIFLETDYYRRFDLALLDPARRGESRPISDLQAIVIGALQTLERLPRLTSPEAGGDLQQSVGQMLRSLCFHWPTYVAVMKRLLASS